MLLDAMCPLCRRLGGARCWARIEALVHATFEAGRRFVAIASGSADNNDDGGGDDGSAAGSLVGIDIIVDAALRPWLIEVNEAPAFGEYLPFAGVSDGAAVFSRQLVAALVAMAEQRGEGEKLGALNFKRLGVQQE